MGTGKRRQQTLFGGLRVKAHEVKVTGKVKQEITDELQHGDTVELKIVCSVKEIHYILDGDSGELVRRHILQIDTAKVAR